MYKFQNFCMILFIGIVLTGLILSVYFCAVERARILEHAKYSIGDIVKLRITGEKTMIMQKSISNSIPVYQCRTPQTNIKTFYEFELEKE